MSRMLASVRKDTIFISKLIISDIYDDVLKCPGHIFLYDLIFLFSIILQEFIELIVYKAASKAQRLKF